ncbi:hypothetical protein BH09ACT6_BH09ACT6_21150 [soil metagenome]
MTTRYLTLEDLLALATDLGVSHVRDIGLLDSAAHRPQSSLYGREAYPSLHEKAAVLLESLVRNHALVDGNKRLGWMAVYVFYGLNGFVLEAPDDAAYGMVIEVATGKTSPQECATTLSKWVTER